MHRKSRRQRQIPVTLVRAALGARVAGPGIAALRRGSAWLLLLAVAAVPARSAEESPAASGWKAGFAEADITPAIGEAMISGFGRERLVTGTLAPLRAQVLALEDAAGRRAVLVTADVLGFGRLSVEALRRRIGETLDVPPSAVCLAASHTHWGPAINERVNFSLGPPAPWYIARLERTILDLAGRACGDLAPAELSYGSCSTRIGMCRRTLDDKGNVLWRPNPTGSYDDHTPVLRIVRQGTPSEILVVGHACHPTSSGTMNRWSPDYPGAMRDRLEQDRAGCRAMFVMGCGGDAKVVVKNPKTGAPEFANTPEASAAAGERLAAAVRERLEGEPLHPLAAELETRIVTGELGFRPGRSDAEIEALAFDADAKGFEQAWARHRLAYPDARRGLRYDVQVWRLGDLTLVALEGEVCSDWGPVVRRLAPTPHAMVVAYANEVSAYIPTARIIREGGYEGDRSHMTYTMPAPFEERMEAELLALLERAVRPAAAGVTTGEKP